MKSQLPHSTMLLEIGCEELPASYIIPVLQQMKEIFENFCSRNQIHFSQINTYATPRRLALMVSDIPYTQPPKIVELKGPPVTQAVAPDGSLKQAALGFAKSQGVAPSTLVQKDTEKGTYIFAIKKEDGKPVINIFPSFLPELIEKISFSKSMRWDNSNIRAQNTEHRTQNTEHRAQNTEHRTQTQLAVSR